jgi:hypothetical protein
VLPLSQARLRPGYPWLLYSVALLQLPCVQFHFSITAFLHVLLVTLGAGVAAILCLGLRLISEH